MNAPRKVLASGAVNRFLAILFALASLGVGAAPGSASTPQHASGPTMPTEPGQPPAGLSAGEWQELRARIEAGSDLPLRQDAYLKASNTGAGDQAGWSVAISGDTLVVGAVGAVGESSNATGVDGNQNSNSADRSGGGPRLRSQRDDLEPTGLPQGLQHGAG